MSFLDSSFSRDNEELSVAFKDHIHIFGTKSNHRSVVENDIR